MDDPFDADECGGDELDDSGFIVRSVHILSADWLGESMVWYFVALMKPQSRQFIEAPLSMRALVMTSLSKVFLRTDRVMRNDFDCLSAIITLLTVSGVLCAWGELLFKNPVHRV